jgi:putative lipoprotein
VRDALRLFGRSAIPLLLACAACTGGWPAPTPPPGAPPAPTPLPTFAPPPAPPPVEAPTPIPRLTLEGTVTYAQRIALTPEAVVQVELRDAAVPESAGAPIAKQVIPRPGQVPVAFALPYLPSSLLPGHRYVLSARITDRGQLQFVTEQPIAALPRPAAAEPLEIVVVPLR